MEVSKTKFCPRCKNNQDVDKFSKDNRKADGLKGICKPCHVIVGREWKKRQHPDRMKGYAIKRYNLEIEEYKQMLALQNNKCASCGQPFTNLLPAHIDHDHGCCNGNRSCGKCVRGLVCPICNRTIGASRDNITVLLGAANYLRQTEMTDTNPTRRRAAENKRSFDDVIGDCLSEDDGRQGHYPRLRHRSLLQASRPNLDETAGRIIASKPNAIDFCVDVEHVVMEVLGNDPQLLQDFLDTYITGDEESIKNSNISQTERSYIEQRMGRLFLTRGLSPVAKYFL